MTLSDAHYAALQQMGIPLWKQRTTVSAAESPAAPIPETASASALEAVRQCILVAENLTADEQKLLAAILKATGLQQTHRQTLEQFNSLSTVPESLETIIDFTAQPVLLLTDAVEFIYCPSLGSMLSDPALKATCWQSLKSIQNR